MQTPLTHVPCWLQVAAQVFSTLTSVNRVQRPVGVDLQDYPPFDCAKT